MAKPKTHTRINITLPIPMVRRLRRRRDSGIPISQQVASAMKRKFLEEI